MSPLGESRYTCLVCRKPIAGDFDDVGVQVEVHVYDPRRGWPHRYPGLEKPESRPVLQAHEGDCTGLLLDHLAQLEKVGLPVSELDR